MMDMFAFEDISTGEAEGAAGSGSREERRTRVTEHFNTASDADEVMPDYNSFPSSAGEQSVPEAAQQSVPEAIQLSVPEVVQQSVPEAAPSLVTQMGAMFQGLLAQQVAPMMARI